MQTKIQTLMEIIIQITKYDNRGLNKTLINAI